MSDVPTGARTPDAGDGGPAGLRDPAPYGDAGADSGPSAGDRAKYVAEQGKHTAAQAAGEVRETAGEQAQRVAREARSQARSLASDLRDRVGEQARGQNDRLVGTLRQTADQLDEMRGERTDSPAAAVVSRVAEGGRQFADYLDRHGPEGVLREVQDFARRRPGAFLATALAAGFVVGRLGKSVAKADDSGQGKPGTDAYVSGTDPYVSRGTGPSTVSGTGTGAWDAPPAVATEYTATGTGTPEVVSERYAGDIPPVSGHQGGPR
jgi:hypothetical protein